MNNVIITGRLTKDPELRQTQSGVSVANFSVAVSEKRKDSAGIEKEITTFVDIKAFGKTAEIIRKFFFKGYPIMIEGKLSQDSWEDKNSGKKMTKISVLLERFEFMAGTGKQAEKRDNTKTYSEPPTEQDEHLPPF